MKTAVIFDMDGVLVDNRDVHIDAFQVLFDRHGLTATREQVLAQFGKTNHQIFTDIFGEGRFSDEQIVAYGREKEAIYREMFKRQIRPAPGLTSLLEGLKAKGAKLAVGSSGPLSNVEFVLDRCKIGHYFDAVSHGDLISHGKPDPEVFLLAAELLGKKPEECLVFEDAIVGIEAGKRAGMTVVAMDTTHPREMLSGYDRIISSFTELDASVLEEF